ncbi:spermatogenesis-associated serine-rich protein 1 [Erethizon dorsatum]
MDSRNAPQGSWLPSISRVACGRELEKIREEGDSGVTEAERRYNPRSVIFWFSFSVQRERECLEALVPEVHEAQQSSEFSLLGLQTKDGQRPEWTFYPRFSSSIHTYHVGKQCFFSGVFLGNRRSVSERTVDKSLGRKRYDIDPRNGIPKLAPGDNPYMSPEQSKGFYQAGSTLPPVNFSLVPYQKKFDTFIPLEPLPPTPSLPFWVKEKANHLKNEIREVEELDNWQPAVPLIQSLFPSGASKNLQKAVCGLPQANLSRPGCCALVSLFQWLGLTM